ncbi:MAG: GIY-YIG nuclease family protein [Oricola sp.]|nr:GIY-YIG nuclease family protein [Oricola sp.]
MKDFFSASRNQGFFVSKDEGILRRQGKDNLSHDQVTVFVYMLRCSDGSYYIGKYQGNDLDTRISEHNNRAYPDSYTAKRLPVTLVWSKWFSRYDEAVACERQLKGWSRAKKEALIRGDWDMVQVLSKRGVSPFGAAFGVAQHDETKEFSSVGPARPCEQRANPPSKSQFSRRPILRPSRRR